jgi:hypothetical protein
LKKWIQVFKFLIRFHEEPLGIIKLDASSRNAGQASGLNHGRGQAVFFEFSHDGRLADI